MALQFVPYSVTMRSRGYVRVPRTNMWIPESVMERRQYVAELAKLAKPIRDMCKTDPIHLALENGATWGDLAQQAQDRADARFVNMTDDEWHAYLRADKSKPWEECQRIFRLRASNKAAENMQSEPEAPKSCAYWYREYTQFPHLYFSSPEEQKQAIADVLADWWTEKGRWRRGAMELAARKIQSAWRQHKDKDIATFESTEAWEPKCECRVPIVFFSDDVTCNMCKIEKERLSRRGSPQTECECRQEVSFLYAYDDEWTDEFTCNMCKAEKERRGSPQIECSCELSGMRCQECMNYDLTANDCQYCGATGCDGYDCRFPLETKTTKCYCGDWVCDGECGVLRCGCIDMCRCGRD
jgi:hypothetical protein